jgi:signal transduction histidine kinase
VAKSTNYALALACGYGLLAAVYIVVSGQLAAGRSASVEELARIETIKGILFVVVTTLGVFLGGIAAMRRIDRDHAELTRRERALVNSQSRVFAGVMAASVAHDANNVLTTVLGEVDEIADAPPHEQPTRLAGLRASILRLVALNRRLLNAGRQPAPAERRLEDLARVIADSVATLRLHKSVHRCRITCRGVSSLPLLTQPLLLHQVVSNLVLNAGEATGGRGRIDVVLAVAGEHACIEVHDDGPGIPPGRRAALFDSLSTTKSEGAGLGLFSVRACVEGLGGTVEVGESPLGGALFTVRLPRDVPAPVAV